MSVDWPQVPLRVPSQLHVNFLMANKSYTASSRTSSLPRSYWYKMSQVCKYCSLCRQINNMGFCPHHLEILRRVWYILRNHHCKSSVQGPFDCEATSISNGSFEARNSGHSWSAGEVFFFLNSMMTSLLTWSLQIKTIPQ